MGNKRGKIWGSTCCLMNKNNVAIHRIEIVKSGFCSEHMHNNKFNSFFVESGELEITIYRTDAGQKIEDKTILRPGESTYVEPGVYHKFFAIKPTIAFEFYWTQLCDGDIIRKNIGGYIER